MQAWVYHQYGGLIGYIQPALDYTDQERRKGMGMVFMISESFPSVALMVFAVWARDRKAAASWSALVVVLLAFFVLKMLFGGLRGSRSNTIWGLFWAAGIIHLWLRPLSRQTFVLGCGVLVVFMYFYFGLFIGWLRLYLARLAPGDPWRLVAPFWVIVAFSVLTSDSDNLVFLVIKDGMVPSLLVWFSLVRTK